MERLPKCLKMVSESTTRAVRDCALEWPRRATVGRFGAISAGGLLWHISCADSKRNNVHRTGAIMKRLLAFSSLIILLTPASLVQAAPRSDLSHQDGGADMFYDDLLPYGEWIEAEPGMLVWRPHYAYDDWQPYTVGRWVWTRHGWYWLSNEPFGWAVFHYGRWSMHSRFGWVWHPGRVWGPAWVEWRYSNSYVGWAPLPPVAVFHLTFGVRFTRHWVAPVNAWCFVPYSSFGSAIHRNHILPQERVRRIIGTTRRGRTTTIDRDVIVNRGVDRDLIERRGSVRIDRFDVNAGSRERSEAIRNGRIETYRPERDTRRNEAISRSPRDASRRNDSPRVTVPRNDSRREYIRPQQERSQVRPSPERSGTRERRVAPNVRAHPERKVPSPAQRTPGRDTRKKRDN